MREIQAFLTEMYAIDAVLAEVTEWQARPLAPMYPVVFFDPLRVKMRDEAVVRGQAVYLALASIWRLKDRKALAVALRAIYPAPPAEAAAAALEPLRPARGASAFRPSWRQAVRRVIYTTNALESVNARVRLPILPMLSRCSPDALPMLSRCSSDALPPMFFRCSSDAI